MSELDPETKARIEAEERYRQEVRAQQTSAGQTTAAVTPLRPTKKKAGCGRWFLYGVGALVVLGIIGALNNPSPDNSRSATTSPSPATQQEVGGDGGRASDASSGAGTQASAPPDADVGDGTVNADGSTDIGVWRIAGKSWYTTRNIGGEYGEDAGENEKFAVVQLTIENITNETQSFSSLIDQAEIIMGGDLIKEDTMLTIRSKEGQLDGQIAPGLRRTGAFAFRIPADYSGDMKFQIQFFNGKRFVMNLKEQ